MHDETPLKINHVIYQDDFIALDDALAGSVLVSFDIETTGLHEYAPNSRIVSVAFSVVPGDGSEPSHWFVGLSHPDSPWLGCWRQSCTAIAKSIEQYNCRLLAQHARFDLRWIYAHTGVDLTPCLAWDTLTSSYLLDENDKAGLKYRAQRDLGAPDWADVDFKVLEKEQKKNPDGRLMSERVPYYQLATYNALDTAWTLRLKTHHDKIFRPNIDDEPSSEDKQLYRLGIFNEKLAVPMIRTITRMEQRGWLLDQEWCRDKISDLSDRIEKNRLRLEASTPGCVEMYDDDFPPPRSYEPTALWFQEWTRLQVQAGNLVQMEMTPAGKPSWTQDVLKRLVARGYETAQLLLDYRKAIKETQFLSAWLDAVSSDGRIHATYSYASVRTGRLSCSDVNMQQIGGELRPAFIATPGYVLIDADFSAIELRVAAHIAPSPPMIEAFNRGDDLHSLMAAQATGKPVETITKEERQKAKAAGFGFLFGMGPDKFRTYAEDSYGVSFSQEEAEKFHQSFFNTWQGLSDWHSRSIRDAERDGYITSPLGRVRHLPGMAYMSDYDYGAAGRMAINSPVQSMASDLLQIAAIQVEKMLPHGRILGMVHDSLIVEVPEDELEPSKKIMEHAMTNLDKPLKELGCTLSVPLEVEMKTSRRWGGEEIE